MIKLTSKNVRLSDYPDYTKRLNAFVRKHNYFTVNISDSFLGISLKKRKKIYKNVLDKFIGISDYFLVYDLNIEMDIVKNMMSFFTKEFSRHRINFPKNCWESFDSILYKPGILGSGSISSMRGGIIGYCKKDDNILIDILKHCSDPCVIENASVGCGRNVLQQAKRNSTSHHFNVIIDKTNSGLEGITFHSNKKDIEHIFKLAAQYCKLSLKYLNNDIEIYKNLKQDGIIE
jgi:hypothetical protein